MKTARLLALLMLGAPAAMAQVSYSDVRIAREPLPYDVCSERSDEHNRRVESHNRRVSDMNTAASMLNGDREDALAMCR